MLLKSADERMRRIYVQYNIVMSLSMEVNLTQLSNRAKFSSWSWVEKLERMELLYYVMILESGSRCFDFSIIFIGIVIHIGIIWMMHAYYL